MNRWTVGLPVLVLAMLVRLPVVARAAVVVNGDFEAPVASWSGQRFSAIPGWEGAFGSIEIQQSNTAYTGQAWSGNQFVELDSDRNSGMFQDIQTVAGSNYTLSFYYSPRNGWFGSSFPASTNQIDVFWEGILVRSISDDGPSESVNLWRLVEVVVQAESQNGFSRLQFNAAGTSDTVGGLLDQVSVREVVPEPSTIALLGIGAIGVVGWAWRRRWKLHGLSPMVLAAAMACLVFCGAGVVSAVTATWTGGAGGTWNTSATNWSGVGGTPWDITNGPGNMALFATAGNVANLSGTVVPGTVQFNQSATVNGTGVFGFGTTTSTMTVDVASGRTATINADFSGAMAGTYLGNKIAKTGLGKLVLSGTTNLITGDGDFPLDAGYTVEGGGIMQITGAFKAASLFQTDPYGRPNYSNHVGTYSAGNSLIVNGSGSVIAGGIDIGGSAFGNNSVTISTPGTQASASYNLIGINRTVTIGIASSNNSLTINNGAYFLYSHGGGTQTLKIGVNAGANNNSILVDGVGSTLDRFNAGGAALPGGQPGASGGSITVGVLGSSNSLTVSNGGHIHPRRISVGEGGSNNTWTATSGATGASADGNNADLRVGSVSGATGNSIVISSGGRYFFNGSSTTRLFAIGTVTGADDNFLQITGANSQFNINNAVPLAIGGTATNNVIANGGNGNHLDVLDGGTLVSTAPVVLVGGSAGNKTIFNLGNGVGSTAEAIMGASVSQSNTYYVDKAILGNNLQVTNRWDAGGQTFSPGVSLNTADTVLKINNGRLTAGQGASMAAAPLVSGVGTVNLSGPSYISTPSGNTNWIDSLIQGSGTLYKEGAGTLMVRDLLMDVNPVSAYTHFAGNGEGTGILNLNGIMQLNVADVTSTTGNWTLVDSATVTVGYGVGFRVQGFTESPPDVWTYTETSGLGRTWTFTQDTGVLNVVPEPSTLALLGIGAIGLLATRWRGKHTKST